MTYEPTDPGFAPRGPWWDESNPTEDEFFGEPDETKFGTIPDFDEFGTGKP